MKHLAIAVLSILTICGLASAGEPVRPAAVPATPRVVILDLAPGSFRAFLGWKTPVLVSADGKLKPLRFPLRKDQKEEDRKPVPVHESGQPAEDWAAVEFDDSTWPRVEGAIAFSLENRPLFMDGRYISRTPIEGNRVGLRAKFRVTDPAQVTDLRLNLGYIGGAVVYVNGVELGRNHLPQGKLGADAQATRYPDEAYVTEGGKIRVPSRDPKVLAELAKVRVRAMSSGDGADGLSIPSRLLRKGVNVIAVDVRGAPVHEWAVERSSGGAGWSGPVVLWPHAMVEQARLTAASGAGVTPNVAAVAGIEISNSQPVESTYAYEYVHPTDKIHPIRMIGTRNGCFSGKVVLSSAGAIKKLRASATELAQVGGKGRIPGAEVQVRWAERTTPKVSWATHWDYLGWTFFDRLMSEFPAEIPVAKLYQKRELAVVPVWVTVHVPADAAAGEYAGTLTVEAEGAAAVKFTVPVHLKVNEWRLPDAKEFVTHQNIYQSPDSVAKYYNVPLWSDKHFELMGKSLSAFKQVGNRLCQLNLVVDAITLGNTESMVRWVRKGGSGVGVQASGNEKKEIPVASDTRTLNTETFAYDFSIAEKYMDLYEKTSGKPGILRLDIWERTRFTNNPTLCVSVLDPATGKVSPMPQPAYGTPENEAFWRPVLTELRQRLEKRGWFDVAAFAWVHYSRGADEGNVDVARRIWPDGRWMHTAHTNPREYSGTIKGQTMPVPYVEYVWGAGGLYDPDAGGQYPTAWKSGPTRIETGFARFGVQFINAIYDRSPLAAYRLVTEAAHQGNLRGLGYLGGDFWPVTPWKDGRYLPVSYPYNGIAMSDCITACFSPGPDGAAFNGRMEMFREGVQVAEAVIFLQHAAEAKTISAELKKKIAGLLDERARAYLRAEHVGENGNNHYYAYECSNWQEREDRLFALCGEVAKTQN